ncbi:MAG: hydrogenase nickel incorporation protein HypB, partial [Oscillospiraceae bacterium]|nr:hydrogenase nickel incorporation protein HypB [Oscillospiraceae bacterium]
LVALINRLKDRLNIGEMDVDIESSLDAQTVADRTGIRSLQIHNGGLCHIDADMTARALLEYDTKGLDLLILENIGNLVCPAEFDTGAHKNVTILSVPEGDDKPLKYPLMYQVCDVVLISKIDTLPYFDFDIGKAKERILALNPKAVFFPLSAKTGEGLDAFCEWIMREVQAVKDGAQKEQ